uniref:Tissue factor pathway inhibitor n=1 Tax=Lepeophtheirus salmonis TaxID=72036 RepID=C1BT07_LEPSM|nr:Tissue factor pathway inhibitor precursor [Lepeophtheirus salmonis]ADD24442.1 Tissue factor pathway inhibitor [Lepeophtheirus salmonis]
MSILKNSPIRDPSPKYKCLEEDSLDAVFVLNNGPEDFIRTPSSRGRSRELLHNAFKVLIYTFLFGAFILIAVKYWNTTTGIILEKESIIERLQTIITDMKSKEKPSQCHMKPDPGPCRSLLPQFYYDFETGRCKSFYYGGCQGNANRFDNEENCLSICSSEEKKKGRENKGNVCKLKADPGPCRALFQRYFFDSEKKICVEFGYGGCQGNENNFVKKSDCEDVCVKNDPGLVQVDPPTKDKNIE